MNNRKIKSTLNLVNETKRVLTKYGWRRDDSGVTWGGDYQNGFTLEGAVEAAARIRNSDSGFLHELLDLEAWNRSCGKYHWAFEYNQAPSRKKSEVLRLLDTVARDLQKWTS